MDRLSASFSALRTSKSSKSLLTSGSKEYPADPAAYELLEDCGRGVSATVRACVQRRSTWRGEGEGGARRVARRKKPNVPSPTRLAQVHRALCKPFNEIVAVKKLNLETVNCNLVRAQRARARRRRTACVRVRATRRRTPAPAP
jgi:hypothetical protein